MSSANKVILAIVIIAIIAIAYTYMYLQSWYAPYYNYPTPSASPSVSHAPTPTVTPLLSPTQSPKTSPASSPAPTPTPVSTPAPSPALSPNPITYNISGIEFGYVPSAITARDGQAITIVFSNNGAAPHNLTFEGLNMATRTINSGQTDTVQFIAPPPGIYTFFCSVDSHRDLGMQGTMTVQ